MFQSRKTDLKKLDFGQDSAESEMEYLKYIFLSLPFFENLKNTRKWLILGRKGSGKTAACLMFFEKIQRTNHVSLITPKSLSATKSAFLEKSSTNLEEAAMQKWNYLFLLEISRYAVHLASEKFGGKYVTWPEPLRKVRTFLVDNDNDAANGLDKSLKFVRSISKLAVGVMKVEASAEFKGGAVPETEDLEALQDLIGQAFQLLDQQQLYFLVDQVDDLWDTTIEGQKLIIGLLRSAKQINDKFDFLKLIVFLRTDIFSYLRFHDSDKYRSQTEFIIWDVEGLKKLIALRIRKSTNLRTDTDGLWTSFFPERMGKINSFDFVIQYTLMRPRDLIQICNKCRDEAINNVSSLITSNEIVEAIGEYSIWKLEDLVSEYNIQYPFLEQIFTSIFYAAPTYEFTREKIQELFEINKKELIEQYGSKYFEPLDILLQILYTIGFIGVVHHDQVLFEFLGDKVVLPYANLFRVHKAFRKGLRLPDPELEAMAGRSKRQTIIIAEDHSRVGSINQTVEGSVSVGRSTSINIGGNISGDLITNEISSGSVKTKLFEKIYTAIDARPSIPPADREDLKEEVKAIETYALEAEKKNEKIDEAILARRFRYIERISPDISSIVVSTLGNSLSHLGVDVKTLASIASKAQNDLK